MVQTPSEIKAKRLPAVFYAQENGAEPVRDWLKQKAFDQADRRKLGQADR